MRHAYQSVFVALTIATMTNTSYAAATDEQDSTYEDLKNVPTVEEMVITGTREKKEWERKYKNVAGKRIFKGPYGNEKLIIAIGQELKNRGEKKRVFTRGISMPQTYTGSSLDNYSYPAEDDCGINTSLLSVMSKGRRRSCWML